MGRLIVWGATAVLSLVAPARASANDANPPNSVSGAKPPDEATDGKGSDKATDGKGSDKATDGKGSDKATDGKGTDKAADGKAPGKADESFHAGRALLKDKRYADACPKFEESQRQDPASGTLLALAYCQELSGLLATSWANYLAAAQLAEREGHSDRQAAANDRAQALVARLSKITVVVPHELLSLPGFHLLRDGIEFERASFGTPVPTDGGSHAFTATAPGRAPWSSTVTLFSERDQKTLIMPVLDAAHATPVAGTADSTDAGQLPRVKHAEDPDHDSRVALQRAGLGFAIGSAVGLVVGAGYGLSAKSKNDDSNADGHCNPECDAAGFRLRHDALSAARVSTVSFIVGGAFAATSVTLFYFGTHRHSSTQGVATTSVQASVLLGAPGVTVNGGF